MFSSPKFSKPLVVVLILLSVTISGQTPEKSKFEIADVHTSIPGLFPQMAGGIVRDDRYEIRSATMVDLIKTAYGVTDEKVFGGPAWMESDRFDVIGKVPSGTNLQTAKLMLQSLLAERFQLKVHNDDKPLPVFALTVGKNGSKLKEPSGSGGGCQPQPQSPQPGAIPQQVVICRDMTMAMFAETLRQMAGGYLDKPVVNMTNLEGSFDLEIKWTPRAVLASAGSEGISIFDAVDKQLGLKLEPQTAPSSVIVVDAVNQKPSANLAEVAKVLPDTPVEFEVADIKPADPNSQGIQVRYTPGGRVDAMGSIKDLIGMAMQIPPNLIADLLFGLPKQMETTRYSILAKLPTGGIGAATRVNGRDTPPPISVALQMLKNLLVERFKLQAHVENREVTAYALTAPKADSKLKKADITQRASCKQSPGAVPAGVGPMVAWTCQNTSLAELAKNLQTWAGGYIDHPTTDRTEIAGAYDFVLMWTPRGALDASARPAEGAPGAGGVAAADPTGLSLFEAVEKQLGLKLEKGKYTIPVTVVDHVEEKPIG
jgi:uncharacterized protein (TIGR03435 family)